jgi:hypothetical protein
MRAVHGPEAGRESVLGLERRAGERRAVLQQKADGDGDGDPPRAPSLARGRCP